MNFTQYVFENSRNLENSKSLDITAVIDNNREISFRNIYKEIEKITSYLIEAKIRKKKILLIADNSEFFIKSYFAIINSGNVCVPVNPTIGENNIGYIANKCDDSVMFIQKKYERLTKYIENKIHLVIYEDFEFKNEEFINDGLVAYCEDIAVVLFTSGSTAVPKGVMLSHKNLIANTESIIEYLKLSKEDRMEVVLPFYYCYGASLLHTHMRVGGSLVINNKFMFPQSVLEDINKYKCTGFAGVPSNFQILLRRTNIKNLKFPSLRYVTQAGGCLQDVFIKELIEVLSNKDIYIMYGQTEATARLSYLEPQLLKEKMGSIGKSINGVTLEVVNEQGNIVMPGEVGQVIASGDNIMKGYLDDEESTLEVLKNHKLYTGDLATVDEDGYIYLVAREKNMIKSGGNRISGKEIENIIAEIDKVVEVVVVGVFDDILGEAIKAFIVIKEKDSVNAEYIKNYCKEKLPSYKVPKYIEIVSKLPKNSSGKVLIKELTGKK